MTRLEEIAAAIAAGADPESFSYELDDLLGTSVPVRDREAEDRWERAYRERPSSD